MEKIALIGAGNLGKSIIEGLLMSSDIKAHQLIATRNRLDLLKSLKEKGVFVTQDNFEASSKAHTIILAVKPFKVQEIIEHIQPVLEKNRPILISVATGISFAQLRLWCQCDIPIFRAMPNTAISTQESLTCLCAENSSGADYQRIYELWRKLGEVAEVSEELMEAATVLGSCGIAYVFRFIRAMTQAGVEIGFDTTTASKIVQQTVKGAVSLLIKNGLHPEQEIDKVATPKGCTITGLNEMEYQGFSSSLIKGILSSYRKIQ